MGESEIKEIFRKNLNRLLSENGYTQADMARHIGVSTAAAAQWATGKTVPRMDKIDRLCSWLGCSRSDLLEDHVHTGGSMQLTDTERRLIVAYRASSDEIQEAVCSILKVRRPASSASADRSA